MLPQTTTENKPQCEKCFNKGYHVDVDSLGKIFIECCPNNVNQKNQAYCNQVNWEKIDPENKEEQSKLKNKGFPQDILAVLRDFVTNWHVIKKQKVHYDMVKNPENYNIVRPIKEHQFTTMHLLTRNQVFQIMGDKDRSQKCTKKSEINGEIIDLAFNREFLGWGGKIHFIISGPILCTYDEEVYDACIKLWHENDTKGIVLETNLSEIWRKMGNESRLNSTKIESLKRTLCRLYTVSITAKSTENKNFWGGGIIDSVIYNEFSRHKDHQVIINFNKHIIYQYLGGSYATLDHSKYQNMTAYAKKIYLFLMSHDDPNRKMGLDKWKSVLGIKESLEIKEFRRKMRDAIKELIELNILLPESMIDSKGMVLTFIAPEAWNGRTDTPSF